MENLFLIITLVSLLGYVVAVGYIISLSSASHISKTTVYMRVFTQYMCSVLLITMIVSLLLHFQAGGKQIMGTSNEGVFITNLMVLTTLATMVVAFNIRFLRIFCQPVYMVDTIPELDQFFLYLRPFDTDKTGFDRYLQEISRESYGSVAIANPHMVIQKRACDTIYATDEEWKDAVIECMKKSKFNILHVGNTDGCLWELEQCINKQMDKTIFIVSTEEGYDVLKKFLVEIDKFIYFPQISPDSVLAFYLKDPTNILSFDCIILQKKDDAQKLVHAFISNRKEIKNELDVREKALYRPITSLFKASSIPKSIGIFSWGFLSPLAFPFVGRLRPIYTIIILGGLFASLAFMQSWIIYLTAAFIAFWGKRMMWLSSQWAGDVAISKQTNFLALITLISMVISYLFAKLYLSLFSLHHTQYIFPY